MEHLDDLIAGLDVKLTDDVRDQLESIVAPGTDIGQLDMAYNPPNIETANLRRRPTNEPTAA